MSDRSYPHSLEILHAQVLRTRAAERTEQARHGINTERLSTARWATLRALEEYAEAIGERGWPVPRLIGRDLALLRALCGSTPRR
jgi:hypothetical protein